MPAYTSLYIVICDTDIDRYISISDKNETADFEIIYKLDALDLQYFLDYLVDILNTHNFTFEDIADIGDYLKLV